MNGLRRLFAARRAELDADRLAARVDALDRVAADVDPSIDEDALVRLAAAVRQLGADAPAPTDATELRRVVLARAVGARGPARRRRFATSGVAMLIVAAAVTVPAWGPPVGSALGSVVAWLWDAPAPDDPRGPVPTPPGPSDGLPSSPPVDGRSAVPSAAPSAEPDALPGSSSPSQPEEAPSVATPSPPTNPTPAVTPPPISPPAPTPPAVSAPAPTPPLPPSPPTLPPLPESPGPDADGA